MFLGECFMSADEKDQQRKDVFWEDHEVNEEIGRLLVKAKTLGERISKFGNWLQKTPALNIYHHEQEQHGCRTEALPPEIHQAMKDWEESFAIADKLRQLQRRLVELKDRKSTLGMI
jgi:hypothetical protein